MARRLGALVLLALAPMLAAQAGWVACWATWSAALEDALEELAG